MSAPLLTIDLDAIEHNSRCISALCTAHAIRVSGVTKAVCGEPEVARAMLRGGVSSIADSRLENIRRQRAAGVDTSFLLLRLPALSGLDEVVCSADCSLNSELATLEGLAAAARRRARVHEVLLMVELGDLREGLWPEDLLPLLRRLRRLDGIRVRGLGANLACFGGVVPTTEHMMRLLALARQAEAELGQRLECVSGLNSSGLPLLAAGGVPLGINHARIGEAILLGRETTHRAPWPGTRQDAFTLQAEVLELKPKPSVPIGERAEDAFGTRPSWPERGVIEHALLNVGRQDIDPQGLAPRDPRLQIIGACSDYLVLDVSGAGGSIRVGDSVDFSLNYSALLRASSSGYVAKRLLRGGLPAADRGRIRAV